MILIDAHFPLACNNFFACCLLIMQIIFAPFMRSEIFLMQFLFSQFNHPEIIIIDNFVLIV